MAGWSAHTGPAVALMTPNIDTDQLIPARFMSRPRASGYGDYLMHDLRRGGDGALNPDFPLNAHPGASILIAGRNFGSGSSREAAVYALTDAGFRAVIAPSFGDIFAGNAINNGLCPVRIAQGAAEALAGALAGKTRQMSVDLESRTLTMGDQSMPFDLPEAWRTKLMNGWDDIDLTQARKNDIAAFRDDRHQKARWAWPSTAQSGAT